MNEELNKIENMTKSEFISYSQEFNIFKTLEEPNYLLIKNKIIEMLPVHDLTENDIVPLPRMIMGSIEAGQIKPKTNINNI